MLYSALKVITDEFLEVLEAQKDDFPTGGVYIREKTDSFRANVKSAVMPVDNSPCNPAEWLHRAEADLDNVEQQLRDREARS